MTAKRLRIAVSYKALNGKPLHPDVVAAVKKTAKLCESLGHIVEEKSPPLDPAVLKALPWARVRSGVVVITTVQGALDSREGGLAMGDVIYAVNRAPVSGVDQLRAAMNGRKPGDAVVLHLDRRGQLMYLAFTVE